MKGLGLKQTYFVEIPEEDSPVADVLIVKSDSPSNSNLRLSIMSDPLIRNPSFVRFNKCTIVNVRKPCQVTQPNFFVTPDTMDTPLEGILMSKPQSSRSNLAVPPNPSIELPEREEIANPRFFLPASSENSSRINQVAPTQYLEKTETVESFGSRTQSEPPSTEKQKKSTESSSSMFISQPSTTIDSSLTSRNPKLHSKCTIN